MKKDKKGEFLKGWIDRRLSKYDWFNGVKYVDVEVFNDRGNKIPFYVFYLDKNGYVLSQEFEDDFDSVFKMFFPPGVTWDPVAVWEFRYV
jgi:hypothetical protein